MQKPQLIIDFYKTISFDTFWHGFAERAAVQKFLFKDNAPLVQEWMLGAQTSEQAVQFASERLGIPYEKLWDAFVRSCRTFKLVDGFLEHLAPLRETYECILLTDNMDSFQRFTVPGLHLTEYFDRIISSSEEHRLKRDTLPSLLRPGAVLIDDSVETCALTQDLGEQGHCVTPDHDVNYFLSHLV